MRIILLTILLGCSLRHVTAATTYDLVEDFSVDQNPAGPWSYGYKSTNTGFALYPTNWFGHWFIHTYYCTPPPFPICGNYNLGVAQIGLGTYKTNPAFEIAWSPNTLPPWLSRPESYPEEPTLRFTSPASGTCTIQLLGYVTNGVVDFHISVNGELVSAQTVLENMTVTNTVTFPVSAGSTLDLGGRATFIRGPNWATLYLSGYITFEPANVPELMFVPAGGLFTNSLDVHLVRILTNGVTRLTLDGTNPSAVSPAYASPVTITNATEFRAAVFDGNTPISQVYTTSFARAYAINDGIPSSWREQYFGAGYLTDPRVAAEADPDGDLATNREEYLAGTNPLDNTSGFKVTAAAVPLIRFVSEPNRVYRILRSNDLSTNRTVVAMLTATNNMTSYVDASVYPNNGFYVIELLP